MRLITGYGAPTPLTVGQLGQRYLDLDTDTKYVCVDIVREEFVEDGVPETDIVHFEATKAVSNFYIWEELASGGTSIPTAIIVVDRSEYGIHLIQGDYAKMKAAISNLNPVDIMFFEKYPGSGDVSRLILITYKINSEGAIKFGVKYDTDSIQYYCWYEDGTIERVD